MKLSRLGLGIALIMGPVLGALGGFMVGRSRQAASDATGLTAAAACPPGTGILMPKGSGSDSASAATAGRSAAIDLCGLPPGEAWRRLMDIGDAVARAQAVALLLNSMPPAEWPIWLAKMIDSFKNEDIDHHDPTAMAALFGTLDAVLQHMVATHPRECVSAMLSLDKEHSHGDDLIEGLMSTWARHDLRAARQFYETEIAGREHGKADDIAKSLVREMAKTDPQGTLAWATDLTDDRARERGMMIAFEAILKADRNKAISLLNTRPDLPERADLAERIATTWAKSDPGRAFEWAQTLPGEMRGAATQRAFDAWLEQDPTAARTTFDAAAPDARSLLLPAMVQRVPKEQIGAFADLLANEPDSTGRAEASRALMRQWVEQDAIAASGWLARQPAGEVHDHAIAGLVSWADGNEPQAALEWAGTIGDPQLRSRYLGELIERYRSSDPAMARSWVDSTPRLTPDERARFLEVTSK